VDYRVEKLSPEEKRALCTFGRLRAAACGACEGRRSSGGYSAFGPTLPISDVSFDGEFRADSGLVLLTWSFVEIDPGCVKT